MILLRPLILFSSFSFLIYGVLCLTTKAMEIEFTRFGVKQFRVLTGILEVLGGLGLLAGFFLPYATLVSSLGLAVLMFLGFCVRLKIKDGVVKSSPALFFCVMNFIIFYITLNQRA